MPSSQPSGYALLALRCRYPVVLGPGQFYFAAKIKSETKIIHMQLKSGWGKMFTFVLIAKDNISSAP